MSLNVEGQKCPVCNAYLFEEDDIVFCPECGAPHHRDCYHALNHCALEQFHGTENQYDASKYKREKEEIPENKAEENTRSDEVKCGMCGKEYDSSLKHCPNCSAPNVTKLGGNYIAFDFLGGVPAGTDIGEGVKADEAKMFVSSNTPRYIPKFAEMAKGRKASWNWFAFLLPSAWLLSRKMYRLGALVTTLNIVLTLLMMPFSIALNSYDMETLGNYQALAKLVAENMNEIGIGVVAAAFLASAGTIALSVLMGIFGDRIYYRHTISTVKEIKQSGEEVEISYRKRGGVSLIGFLIGFFAVRFLPNIIIAFLI